MRRIDEVARRSALKGLPPAGDSLGARGALDNIVLIDRDGELLADELAGRRTVSGAGDIDD